MVVPVQALAHVSRLHQALATARLTSSAPLTKVSVRLVLICSLRVPARMVACPVGLRLMLRSRLFGLMVMVMVARLLSSPHSLPTIPPPPLL
jgi:hypothetical protein